jgi:CheY-like chemotaxis protein
MPIVDGLTSTKMIRSFEKTKPTSILSIRASRNGRVPVIAVSASLVEKERRNYIEAGFDGWILKPISFPRLSELLLGIVDEKVRKEALYKPGNWEHGGWFHLGGIDAFTAVTIPDDTKAASSSNNSRPESVDGSGLATSNITSSEPTRKGKEKEASEGKEDQLGQEVSTTEQKPQDD